MHSSKMFSAIQLRINIINVYLIIPENVSFRNNYYLSYSEKMFKKGIRIICVEFNRIKESEFHQIKV